MEYLAGDALEGRGSGTVYEHRAATYIAQQLKEYGIQPAGHDGSYVDQIDVQSRTATGPPVLAFQRGQQEVRWTHGREFVAKALASGKISGSLQKIEAASAGEVRPQAGAVVYVAATEAKPWAQASEMIERGAAAVLIPHAGDWQEVSKSLPQIARSLANQQNGELGGDLTELWLSADAARQIASLADGTAITIETPFKTQKELTWNVVGKIAGTDPKLRDQTVLLSAHIDHLGIGPAVNGKTIYHGADDDASGVSAVLELARALAAAPPPRRTVMFAFFGSEEDGGLGSTWFREHPPVPLERIVADLEFEMLGRPDNAIPVGALWLTGYDRTNLGPELDKHGAHLVADPRPEQRFFQRSDNFVLAKKGVVAQTVSSFGLHKDYHRPGDDLAHIDFEHLDSAIESMIGSIEWLANSDFKPAWKPGAKP